MSNEETSPAVRLLIKSGVVPANVLQQLVGWRLLPEACAQSLGSQPVTMTSEWKTVEAFVHALEAALRDEAQTIRETEFNQSGGFERGWLHIVGHESREENLFVDRLGRVVLPGDQTYEGVIAVSLIGSTRRKVTRIEPRYKGNRRVAWVCCLEPQRETDDAELDQKLGKARHGELEGDSGSSDGSSPL